MAETNETIEKLEKLKGFLVQLTAKKTKLESDGVIFEFNGDLEEGKEVTFLEGEGVTQVTLEDGRTIVFEDNKVKSILSVEDHEINEAVRQVLEGSDDPDAEDDEEIELESDETENELELEEDDNEEEVEADEHDEHEEDESEEEMEIDVEERINQLEGLVGALTEKVNALEESQSELLNSLTTALEKNVEMAEQIEKLSKSPAVSTDKKEITNGFNKTKTKSRASMVFAAK